ncbi:MAG: NACHT domain-containing protein [Defluviicoccus sp.]|nr:NACHT domain-containing protein [Defluviicoccus sp.]
MKTTPSTISLEVPKRRIAADLVGMMRHLGRAAAQGSLLENWPGAVQELFAAAATISIQRSEGELAWQLVLTGIGEALTELANDQPPTLINESDTKNIIERVENDATDLVIPVDFLDHPWSLSPVALAKQTLLMWLTPNDSTDFHQDLTNLCHRFDSALILGLHRTIRKDEARYQQLLALRDDPTRSAWQMLEDWRLYRAQLIADFRTSPVFDESFALDQIYVPLNAWRWIKYDAETKDERKEIRAVSPLNADMLAWLRGEREKGRLRLISGGPGSGKSSAMKALAAELATNGNDGHPTDVLLFPLQRFQWRMGIVESVAATLNTYSNQLRHNPIDADHLEQRDRPLLLIFDGLDELTANTEVSEAISATFLRALDTVFHFWEGRPVWAIVTGRDAIFGNIEGPTTNLPGERFHLLPYHVRNHEHGAPDRRDYHDPGSLLAEDNRRDAFYRYTRAKGESTDQLPNAYSNDDLHDVTSQPLLNYFILTSGPDEIEDSNLARIYRRLFDRLHERNRNVVSRSNGAGKPGAGLNPRGI